MEQLQDMVKELMDFMKYDPPVLAKALRGWHTERDELLVRARHALNVTDQQQRWLNHIVLDEDLLPHVDTCRYYCPHPEEFPHIKYVVFITFFTERADKQQPFSHVSMQFCVTKPDPQASPVLWSETQPTEKALFLDVTPRQVIAAITQLLERFLPVLEEYQLPIDPDKWDEED